MDGIRQDVEFEIVRCCARRTLRPHDQSMLRELAGRSPDWKRVQRLALRHGLAPLVHRHLVEDATVRLPEEFEAQLRTHQRASALRNLRWVQETVELLGALESAAVLAVPYKGPALAAQLYGSLALRESVDLDIVVSPQDVVAARSVLLDRGYESRCPAPGADRAFVVRKRYSESFLRPPGHLVELHWAFTNGDMNVPLDLDTLWPGLGELELGGHRVPCFAPEDLLVLLSVHGAKHRWARLESVAGVAQLIRDYADLDWRSVLHRARSDGYLRIVLLAACMGEMCFDIRLPNDVRRALAADRKVLELAQEAAGCLMMERMISESDQPSGSLDHDLFHYKLRERFRDRIRFLTYRITTPSEPGEWRTWRVGPWSVPVHALTRPARLFGKLGPAVLWRLRGRGSRRWGSVT